MNFAHPKNKKYLSVWSARLIFVAEAPKPDESAKKPPETGKEKDRPKPTLEQKAATYSVEDLKKTKDDALNVLTDRIKHPAILREAKGDLEKKLGPIEQQLKNLTDEQARQKLELKTFVEQAIQETLTARREFKDLTVSGYVFKIDPPRPIDQYAQLERQAAQTIDVLTHWDWGGEFENPPELVNGVAKMKVLVDKNNPKNPYKTVVIEGTKVTQQFSDPEIDLKINNGASFQEKFEKWKKDPNKDLFSYGMPPNFFPPPEFNMEEFLGKYKITKSDLTLAMLLGEGDLLNHLIADQKTTVATIEPQDGKYVRKDSVEREKQLLTGREKITERQGEVVKETVVAYTIINQERRKVAIVTEYWPSKEGEKIVRKQEKYSDGVVISEKRFDKEGKLIEAISRVNGCEGVEAVDRPIGPPYKEAQVLDEHGNPRIREDGQPVMERTVERIMTIKDKSGKEIAKICHFKAENEYRAKQGLKPLSEDEYMKKLAAEVKTDQQMHAFLMLMFQYCGDTEDANSEGEYWQSASETLKRTANGRMLGDCEDYSFFMARLLKEQSKTAYVLGLPGHAECIQVTKDADGKYHATSYSNFGLDKDGNRVGEREDKNKTKGYTTKEEALRSLQPKWHAKNSGNPEMGSGDLTALGLDSLQARQLSVMGIEDDLARIAALHELWHGSPPPAEIIFNNTIYSINKGGLIYGGGVYYKKMDNDRIGKYTMLAIDRMKVNHGVGSI